jgi:5-methylcytosine-specific restriction endonuclease McrA
MCNIHYCRDYHRRNRDRELANYKRRYRAKRDQERARSAAYYREHREQLSARARERRRENPEQHRAWAVEWRRRDPGYSARWRKANPERWSLRNRENARRRRQAVGPVSYAAILERDGMVCHLCGGLIASVEDLHFDHVVPLSRGGEHSMENIRPSHEAGNRWKHNKLMEELRGDPPCRAA